MSDDIYQKVGDALRRDLDIYQIIDTDDGIALVGENANDVWLLIVKEAALRVTAL